MTPLSPVVVYPNHIGVAPGDPEPFLASVGEYQHEGQQVTWRHSADEHEAECAYCQDGRCEQRIESCAAWKRGLVIHDRPRMAQ